MIYLDNSATTRVLPEAAAAVQEYMLEGFFNASSAYGPAVEADRRVQAAREALAGALHANAKEIVFTSGGTESNNMAIFGAVRARRERGGLITGAAEHASVYEPFQLLYEQGYRLSVTGVDAHGRIKVEEFTQSLQRDTILVSIMHVNNETGAVNDIAAIHAAMRRYAPEALLHVDGVQAFLKMQKGRPPCDLYSISAHKFHGPKGVGALYMRAGIPFRGGQIGGGQERGMRSGTTNSPGILGMDAALAAYRNAQAAWVNTMQRNKLRLAENLLQIPDVMINGPRPEDGAPHILNMSFLGVQGEVLLQALSAKGVYVSTGSACSARKKGKNRILNAMGIVGARQEGAIRFSLCPMNTAEEMDRAAEAVAGCVKTLRNYRKR